MEETKKLPCWKALGIIFGIVLFGVFVWKFPNNTTEWAAWVQAFGTVGAVGATLFVMKEQMSYNRKLARELASKERVSSFNILSTLSNELISTVKSELNWLLLFKHSAVKNVDREKIESFVESREKFLEITHLKLREIDWSLPPNALIAREIINIEIQFHFFREELLELKGKDWGKALEKMKGRAEVVNQSVWQAIDKINLETGLEVEWHHKRDWRFKKFKRT